MDSLRLHEGRGPGMPESRASLPIDAATTEKGCFRMKTRKASASKATSHQT
jgi:hypothetical protein